MSPSQRLVPNTVFAGQFRVIEQIAQGGMGTIYRVEQLPTNAPRALKIILPEYAQDAKVRARFEQEARIVARIESEHVAQLIGAGVDPESNTPWIAMELLHGQDLAAVLAARGRLPPAEVFEMLKQLGHALSAAHRIGVIHRDLKPENLFVANARRSDAAFTMKVLDFGVAKWLQENRPAAQATAVVGSPLWMAPEQLDARGILGPHTDVWAVGLLAFAMLVGRPYWRGANPEGFSLPDVVAEIMAAPLAPASQRAAEFNAAHTLPPGFDAWFARCVDRDGAMRFRSIDDTLRALFALAPQPAPAVAPHAPAAMPATVAMPALATPAPAFAQPASTASTPPSTMAWSPGAQPFAGGAAPFPPAGPTPMPASHSQPPAAPFTPFAPPPVALPYAPQQAYAQQPLYGAAPAAYGAAAPWSAQPATPAPKSRAGLYLGLAALAIVALSGAGAAVWFLTEPAPCAANHHRSSGHCCANGAEWDGARNACVCQNLALCGTPQTVATPTLPTTPVVPTLPPTPPMPTVPGTPQMTPLPSPAPMPSPTPRPSPAPTPSPAIHACDGVWSGSLSENTGARGSMTMMVRSTAGTCARWTERWQSGAFCVYQLTNCTVRDGRIEGVGRTYSRNCSGPVNATIECSRTGATFREVVGQVVDTGRLARP